MSKHHNKDGGPAKIWTGSHQFENPCTLFARSMEVTEEKGKNFSGRLNLYDAVDGGRYYEYPWQATYSDDGRWSVVGKGNGNGVSAIVVNEIGVFLGRRLEIMMQEGNILRRQSVAVGNNGLRPVVVKTPPLAVEIAKAPPPVQAGRPRLEIAV